MSRVQARPMRARSGLWAVVPVKRFSETKRRLTPLLSANERSALAGAMLDDVLTAIARARGLAGTIVVTDEHRAVAAARGAGAVVMSDRNGGLNAAVAAAAHQLSGDGGSGILVLPIDVPLITATDVESIILAHRTAPSVTLVPAESDGGTNALACSPPRAVARHFGENSLREHQEAARAAGIAATVLRIERLGHDIDRPEDLARFIERPSPTRSYAYLVASGIARRLCGIDVERCRVPVAAEAPP